MAVFLAATASGLFLLATVEQFREYWRQAFRRWWGVALMAVVYVTAVYMLFSRPMVSYLSDQDLLVRLAHPTRFQIAWAVLSFWPLGPLLLVLLMSVTEVRSHQQEDTHATTRSS
jgi:uncharacterized membrane protein